MYLGKVLPQQEVDPFTFQRPHQPVAAAFRSLHVNVLLEGFRGGIEIVEYTRISDFIGEIFCDDRVIRHVVTYRQLAIAQVQANYREAKRYLVLVDEVLDSLNRSHVFKNDRANLRHSLRGSSQDGAVEVGRRQPRSVWSPEHSPASVLADIRDGP